MLDPIILDQIHCPDLLPEVVTRMDSLFLDVEDWSS